MAKGKKSPPEPEKKDGNAGESAQARDNATKGTQYEEQQNDEIAVLRSIFPEDFREVETKSAWSRKTEKSFRLKLVAESDSSLSAQLAVTFTATYPKTLPLLSLECASSVPEKTRERVTYMLGFRPKELLGEVMILELSNDIRDALEDTAQALAEGRAVPSLEEERAKREAEAEQRAREDEAREARRVENARAEEELAMQQMVEEELKRRETNRKKRQSQVVSTGNEQAFGPSDIVFDHLVRYTPIGGAALVFLAVTIVDKLSAYSSIETLKVKPMMAEGNPSSLPFMVVKRVSISRQRAKKPILDLEDDLEKLKTVRSENLLNVLEFKLDNGTLESCFSILVESASGPAIKYLLKWTTIDVSDARAYAIDILQGIDFLHKQGLVHGNLDTSNIFICESDSGRTAKLANCCFQRRFLGLVDESTNQAEPTSQQSCDSPWICPELRGGQPYWKTSNKSDIWDFGVIILEMLFGNKAKTKYLPQTLSTTASLTRPFKDFVSEIFRSDPKRRPSAFDLIPYEFLRTDAEATEPMTGAMNTTHRRQSTHQRSSNEEVTASFSSSRYATEWFEVGRLGRGGYGEVVKARNRLDGRVYAVKKIIGKTQTQLSEVLSEVYLLATLNHPYVVRYYTAWPEEETVGKLDNSSTGSTTNDVTEENCSDLRAAIPISFDQSAAGHDFISSAGYPKIEFGNSDEDDTSADDDDDYDKGEGESEEDDVFERSAESLIKTKSPKQTQQDTRAQAPRATLFIQMEFCEKLTLRDIIHRGASVDEAWRLLRQIVEGLVHIHGHGIIHRDLKPENVFIDSSNNPKIGDFGLATTGRARASETGSHGASRPSGDMTLSVGTALYVAPELKSSAKGNYTEKVDMYSVGIIFFEMCFPLPTNMERIQTLTQLRQKDHSLPAVFQQPDKQLQAEIIESLIQHKPSERPASSELLRSGRIPVQVEDEQIRQALSSLSDSSSPYFSRMMETLFTQTSNTQVQSRLWDANRDALTNANATDYVLLQGTVKAKMASIFRRYGAIEVNRQAVFPKSSLYSSNDIAQYIDATGTLVQLPYDLIYPHARIISRQSEIPRTSFTFGTVFRATAAGGAPRNSREADFDIISYNASDDDLAVAEAEVIKCLDDLIIEFPCFSNTPICFHLSHSGLLTCILDACRIPSSQHLVTKNILGKLHIGTWTWQKIRTELRAPSVGISSSSIDDLSQFDFRDTPERSLRKLQALLNSPQALATAHSVFTHISALVEYLKRFGVRKRFYFSPLSSLNERLYRGGVMFQCVFDTKKRDILAAGGRYDVLVDELRPPVPASPTKSLHAVGTNIAWDRIVSSMLKQQRTPGKSYLKRPSDAEEISHTWQVKQFDVLIASFDAAILRSAAIKLAVELRTSGLSAKIAVEARDMEELRARYEDSRYAWLVTIKHEDLTSSKSDIKLKNMDTQETRDLQSSDLVNFLRAEVRDREQREGGGGHARLHRHASHPESAESERKNDVRVLLANHKSKKTNKARIIEDAQERVGDLLSEFGEGPVAAVEARDDLVQRLRETRLSDADSWRKLIQSMPISDRQYCHELLDLITAFKIKYGETYRKCFIYNFRTGSCIDYDLAS